MLHFCVEMPLTETVVYIKLKPGVQVVRLHWLPQVLKSKYSPTQAPQCLPV